MIVNARHINEYSNRSENAKQWRRYTLCRWGNKIIDDSGLHFRVGPLETTVQGDMSECLILIQKLHERMVELECPSIISQVKFYHVSAGITIETLTGKYDNE